MKEQRICFRADASAEIGYGHFIRTLALAAMLKDDFDCVFCTQEPSEYQKREMKAVCPFRGLPADDTRFELFLKQLKGDEIVVLDNYFYTTDYQRKIKEKGCRLVCIDDMHNKHYVADVVVNHGNVSEDVFDVEPYTRLCIGNQWKLLRKPFLTKPTLLERNNTAIICLGGADPFHLTDKIVSMALKIARQYQIVVILGDKVFLSEHNRFQVQVRRRLSAEQLAALFETSSFGIFPGSTVSIEAASRGLPMLIGYQADNQEEGYFKLADKGFFIPLGDLRLLDEKRLASAISKLNHFNPIIPDYSMVSGNFVQLFKSI